MEAKDFGGAAALYGGVLQVEPDSLAALAGLVRCFVALGEIDQARGLLIGLTPAQEALWPGVETALRSFAKAMHDRRQANPAGAPLLEADSAEVEQLKAAAQPLLAQLREEQKREVRSLARIIGLDAVASQI